MNKLLNTFKKNYTLYLIEAWGLGSFMISASLFTILLEHPALHLSTVISSDLLRRMLIGLAMGITAIGIIASPWGRKSGAHINPAVTFTMWYLNKISWRNVLFYIPFQLIGGTLGVLLIVFFFPDYMAHPSVCYVVTVPGKAGLIGAIIGETLIAFLLMSITLLTSNHSRWKLYTPYITGLLISCFVTFEAPYSGFSMNPARTLASAIPANIWTAWPFYLLVPIVSMLAAAMTYTFLSQHKKEHLRHYFEPKKIKQPSSD